jgi:hypothetical protein
LDIRLSASLASVRQTPSDFLQINNAGRHDIQRRGQYCPASRATKARATSFLMEQTVPGALADRSVIA